MAWTNIFDLADWDLYIQFNGQTDEPSPPSNAGFVPISELDPAVGTVTVEDGVIVCDMEELALAMFPTTEIAIVAVPSGVPPVAAPARVSLTLNGAPYVVKPESAFQYSAEGLNAVGDGTFTVQTGALSDEITEGVPVTNDIYAGGDLPTGEGLVLNAQYTSGGA